MKIRSGDEVIVIAGKDKGKRGKVLRVLPDKNKVVVEGVNVIVRHLKRNPQNPQQGGRVERVAPLHVSNVMLWSEDEKRGVRVRYEGDGKDKHRVSTRTGKPLTQSGRKKERRSRKGKGESQEG